MKNRLGTQSDLTYRSLSKERLKVQVESKTELNPFILETAEGKRKLLKPKKVTSRAEKPVFDKPRKMVGR